MNDRHLVVHTYLDLQATKEENRPVWRSIVKEYPEWVIAHTKMRESFARTSCLTSKMISASFGYDSAYIETVEGGKKIWTITKVEG